jgi:aryl-alcohol dehydrogenase-like predicted oxidoreductase
MRYHMFGRTGLVVSEVALGGGNFGMRWGYGAAADEARSMFRGYIEAGGNFLDTADGYQFGESEQLMSEFVGSQRDDFVLATKYTAGTTAEAGFGATGNSRKNMMQSVEGSLRRLKTDRIDIYWAHFPDNRTPVDEIARGFEDLVRAGKIIYAGLSDFPAWRVTRAVTLAELRGWAPISGIQIEYSLVERTPERELLPMAHAFGLGVTAWGVLGGGLLSGKYRRGEQGRADTFKAFVHDERTAQNSAVLDAAEAIAKEVGATTGQVTIAWACQKGVTPILGPRTRAQLDENLGSLAVHLSRDQVQRLDVASAISLGFPHEMLASEQARKRAVDRRLQLLDPPASAVI